MAVPFIPGLQLACEFHSEVVRPLLAENLPGLRYAAALLGPGSEVAGFDTARSTDAVGNLRLLRASAGAAMDVPASRS